MKNVDEGINKNNYTSYHKYIMKVYYYRHLDKLCIFKAKYGARIK